MSDLTPPRSPSPRHQVKLIEHANFSIPRIDVLVYTSGHSGGRSYVTREVALPVTLHELTEEDRSPTRLEPTFSLEHDDAQALCDQLYTLGFLPRGIGGVGELAALRSHLTDMRRIVGAKLRVPLPETER